jgi:hypothetical protein
MTIHKQISTQQPPQQQPLSLSETLRYLPTLRGLALPLPVRSMSKLRQQDPEQQQAFLLSMLEQAIEIANDVDAYFPEESCADNAGGEKQEGKSRSQNQNQ